MTFQSQLRGNMNKDVYNNSVLSVNLFSFLLPERASLLLNAPHPEKIALTSGAHKSEFHHFQYLELVKFQKS